MLYHMIYLNEITKGILFLYNTYVQRFSLMIYHNIVVISSVYRLYHKQNLKLFEDCNFSV